MKVRETKRGEMTVYVFRCPGCFLHHALDSRYTLAGDLESPTFTPEVNISWGPNRCHFAIAGGAINDRQIDQRACYRGQHRRNGRDHGTNLAVFR